MLVLSSSRLSGSWTALLSQWHWLCTFLCLSKVESCDPLTKPDHGSLECDHPLASFSYNSSCAVECEEGYELTALGSVRCTSSGVWSAPLAACKGELLKLQEMSFLHYTQLSKLQRFSARRYKLSLFRCSSLRGEGAVLLQHTGRFVPEEMKWAGWMFWPWSRFPCRERLFHLLVGNREWRWSSWETAHSRPVAPSCRNYFLRCSAWNKLLFEANKSSIQNGKNLACNSLLLWAADEFTALP